MNAYSIKIIVLINVQYFLSLIAGVVLLINDHAENSEYLSSGIKCLLMEFQFIHSRDLGYLPISVFNTSEL